MSNATEKIGMTPSHPGAFIREEVLEPLKLTITAAAEILDVRTATLSDLLNAKAGLSPEMALRLEKAFDLDMDQMLRMQAWFDTHQMRQRAGDIKVKRYDAPTP